jgi:hypothetical protein
MPCHRSALTEWDEFATQIGRKYIDAKPAFILMEKFVEWPSITSNWFCLSTL